MDELPIDPPQEELEPPPRYFPKSTMNNPPKKPRKPCMPRQWRAILIAEVEECGQIGKAMKKLGYSTRTYESAKKGDLLFVAKLHTAKKAREFDRQGARQKKTLWWMTRGKTLTEALEKSGDKKWNFWNWMSRWPLFRMEYDIAILTLKLKAAKERLRAAKKKAGKGGFGR